MLKIFSSEQVKRLDAYTIENEPITSDRLMERAAGAMTEWIYMHFDDDIPFIFFIGPGNNGGDGLVMARLMMQAGYSVRVVILEFTNGLSPDAEKNLKRFEELNGKVLMVKEPNEIPDVFNDEVIVDAIFGAGLSRPVDGFAARIIDELNRLENMMLSVDIPSGLFGEDNYENSGSVIRAEITLALQFPNLSFLMTEYSEFIGDWVVVDIALHPDAIKNTYTPYALVEIEDVKQVLKRRNTFAHKGNFGHALLIAGSFGKMGACILASKACLRSGVGLLSCHIPQVGYNILQTSVPEAMISIDRSDVIFSKYPDLSQYSAVGVGPGLGTKNNTKTAMKELVRNVSVPLVLDADALNCISENKELLSLLPDKSIITPHPKEFERLFGPARNSIEMLEKQREMAQKYKLVIVCKGAFTRIALPDGSVWFNSTGNPGMATAGSGDVLTGIILSFLAQGYEPEQAALLSVFIHGMAADEYVENSGMESLIASDIIDNLGIVFKELSV